MLFRIYQDDIYKKFMKERKNLYPSDHLVKSVEEKNLLKENIIHILIYIYCIYAVYIYIYLLIDYVIYEYVYASVCMFIHKCIIYMSSWRQ